MVRPRSPYEALLRDIEPGHDDFPLEKEAFEMAARAAVPLGGRGPRDSTFRVRGYALCGWYLNI